MVLDPGGSGCERGRKFSTGGAAVLEKKMGLGLGIFVFFSDVVKIAPPLFELWTSIYR
jgi:hypothetical protein